MDTHKTKIFKKINDAIIRLNKAKIGEKVRITFGTLHDASVACEYLRKIKLGGLSLLRYDVWNTGDERSPIYYIDFKREGINLSDIDEDDR